MNSVCGWLNIWYNFAECSKALQCTIIQYTLHIVSLITHKPYQYIIFKFSANFNSFCAVLSNRVSKFHGELNASLSLESPEYTIMNSGDRLNPSLRAWDLRSTVSTLTHYILYKSSSVCPSWTDSIQACRPWVCRVCHGTPRFWQIS